jgi:HK97 family phage prohead protease
MVMPLPKPKKDETKDDFIERCMGNDTMKEEYPDNGQRLAVCQSQWDNKESKEAMPEDIERRIMPFDDTELRVEGDDKPIIKGYAAKFNSNSEDLGGFVERIKPGAFSKALKDSDIRALKNHDPNLLLGRNKAGTMRIDENKVGLRFEVDVPNTATGRDTVEEIRRGDITGCSFAFTIKSDAWEENDDGPWIRTINEVKQLFDVGPVVYPAYPDTTVAARSLDELKKGKEKPPEPEKKEELDYDPKEYERKYRKAQRISARMREELKENNS